MSTLLSRLSFASIFQSRRPPAAAQSPRPAVHAAVAAMPSTRELELEEIRSAAMRQMFPKLFTWCADRWDRGVAVEVHNYLAGANSVADLEQRIRAVERKRHFSS